MQQEQFKPKKLYRELDSLMANIQNRAETEEALALVLEKLVEELSDELGIMGGCVYKFRVGYFRIIRETPRDSEFNWPDRISKYERIFNDLNKHKSYIFTDSEQTPPWGSNSVAALVGEDDQYMMVLKLKPGWQRESIEFSINIIRDMLNYSRFARRLETDMKEAHAIQRSLLPQFDPEFPGYEIAARSLAAESVGGDFYDYQKLDEDLLAFSIGDASGHGLPAALLVRDVVIGLRIGIEKEMKISSIVKKLNDVISRSRLSTKFVSMFFGELEENGTLVYVNAGHPRPVIIKEKSEVELATGGSILGPVIDNPFMRGFAFIDPGDVLVMLTDGILERRNYNNEMFGKEKVVEMVRERRDQPASKIVDDLFNELYSFGGGEKLGDDATLFIIKRIN
ncbi:MAG: SpoIIE family protein phosphatase [Candidatus Latescibacteria bacterium]|nr:SpoIIE family protein phosphatase [bacterium]MBD3423018.1 SpoIIE family protein phosphatase [Candidatus Latescibacterota bacterium]